MKTNVEVLSPTRNHAFVAGWYELTTPSHFWFQWRMLAARLQLKSVGIRLDKKMHALEVGCGTGVLRTQFEAETSWTVDATDLNYDALCKVEMGRGRVLHYDVREELKQLTETYDVAILFDVLEHIENTRPFLKSVLAHLKPNGYLLVNVPAVQLLYSKYDLVAGHVRRYDKKSLSSEFHGLGFRVVDLRYWGMSLLPLLVLRKVIQKIMVDQTSEQIIRTGFRPPGALLNKMFCMLMRTEAFIVKVPPLGSSLLMVGRKTACGSESP